MHGLTKDATCTIDGLRQISLCHVVHDRSHPWPISESTETHMQIRTLQFRSFFHKTRPQKQVFALARYRKFSCSITEQHIFSETFVVWKRAAPSNLASWFTVNMQPFKVFQRHGIYPYSAVYNGRQLTSNKREILIPALYLVRRYHWTDFNLLCSIRTNVISFTTCTSFAPLRMIMDSWASSRLWWYDWH
jgi:hypothetical protein